MNYKLDTDQSVFFYEQEFYVLSNFSAFTLYWDDHLFMTSEAAYHWEKFPEGGEIRQKIISAPSAHEAFKISRKYEQHCRPDWKQVRVGIMKQILLAKVKQHDYVYKKLLATGSREIVEDSWRDSFWGWGPEKNGKNMLGKLWMEIREELLTNSN